VNAVALPRFGSISDGTMETIVSEVVSDLARIGDMTTVPRVSEPLAPGALAPLETWMVDVVRLGMCVQGILDISPLGDEETLRLLAGLVSKRFVTCSPRACGGRGVAWPSHLGRNDLRDDMAALPRLGRVEAQDGDR
jgi:hypothetical protein